MPLAARTAALLDSADAVEAYFYDALREADIEKLMSLWAEDDEVICIHPGGPRLVGRAAVRAAFEAVFANGGVALKADRLRTCGSGGCSVHSVVEQVEMLTDDGPRVGYVMATNVYVQTSLGWRMIAHHASAGTAESPPELVEQPSTLH